MAAGVGKTYRMLQEGREPDGRDTVDRPARDARARRDRARRARASRSCRGASVAYRGTRSRTWTCPRILARAPRAVPDRRARPHQRAGPRARQAPRGRRGRAGGRHRRLLDAQRAAPRVAQRPASPSSAACACARPCPTRCSQRADEVVLIDLTPEALLERLRDGKVYPAERVEAALNGFFRIENLTALRETALRQVAEEVESPSGVVARRGALGSRRSASGCWRSSQPAAQRAAARAPRVALARSASAPTSTSSGSSRPAARPTTRPSARLGACASSPPCSVRTCSIDASPTTSSRPPPRRSASAGRPTCCSASRRRAADSAGCASRCRSGSCAPPRAGSTSGSSRPRSERRAMSPIDRRSSPRVAHHARRRRRVRRSPARRRARREPRGAGAVRRILLPFTGAAISRRVARRGAAPRARRGRDADARPSWPPSRATSRSTPPIPLQCARRDARAQRDRTPRPRRPRRSRARPGAPTRHPRCSAGRPHEPRAPARARPAGRVSVRDLVDAAGGRRALRPIPASKLDATRAVVWLRRPSLDRSLASGASDSTLLALRASSARQPRQPRGHSRPDRAGHGRGDRPGAPLR